MLRMVAIALVLSGVIASARAANVETRIADFVDALATEDDECAFLRALCRAARDSIGRAEGTPSAADLLVARQDLLAEARLREVEAGADAIERKRGKRPACFADAVCRGIVPPPHGRGTR